MVSYKVVFSKIFTRSSSYNTSDGDNISPYRPTPSRALSNPVLPASKYTSDGSSRPRRPKVLVRRPHSTYAGPSTDVRGFFTRSRRNSTDHTRAVVLSRSPAASITEHDLVIVQPTIPFVDFETEIVRPIAPPAAVRDSSDIDLLLSNEPADAKKAIIKRLEGLTLALDMVDGAGLPTPRAEKKPSISFSDLPPHMNAVAFESLSPIENWEDEDDMDRNIFACSFSFGDDMDAASSSYYSHAPSASSTESESSISSFTDDSRLPPTPNYGVAQYPVSFRLEPIPQLTLDICKSTPSPVFPCEISDHASQFSMENVVVSWDSTSTPLPP